MSTMLQAKDRLGANTVEYYLYPKLGADIEHDRVLLRQELDNLIGQYYSHLTPHLTNYIWHDESFCLQPVIIEATDLVYYFYGRTHFEDNIEDEYFVLFLLHQLTLFDKDLVVKVADDDGEILLIEAAKHLPKWASGPSNTTNRVYLHKGEMHLIDPSLQSEWTTTKSSGITQMAVTLVRQNFEKTRCSDAIQNCLYNRIGEYPAKIRRMQHRARCYLPMPIVSLLHSDPQLISHIVRVFYHRTPVELKKILASLQSYQAEHFVETNITFTRCLYSQLTSQECTPTKNTVWAQLLADAKINSQAIMNGFKVTVGLEILLCNYLDTQKHFHNDDVENHPKWSQFIVNLKRYNYFQEQLPGSIMYQQLLNKCKEFFKRSFSQPIDSIASASPTCHPGFRIHQYLQTANIEELMRNHQMPLEPEDDSSWMYLSPEELDQLLSKKFGCKESSVELEQVAQSIPETLKQFVNNEKAGLQGAEAPKKRNNHSKNMNDKVKFDADEFDTFMKEIQYLTDKSQNKTEWQNTDDSSDSSELDMYGSDSECELEPNDNSISQFGESSKQTTENHIGHGEDQASVEMAAYIKQMDIELAKSTIRKSFVKSDIENLDSDDESLHDGNQLLTETTASENDIDLNALSNILQSYSGEADMSTSVGPATSLFATMATKLPDVSKE